MLLQHVELRLRLLELRLRTVEIRLQLLIRSDRRQVAADLFERRARLVDFRLELSASHLVVRDDPLEQCQYVRRQHRPFMRLRELERKGTQRIRRRGLHIVLDGLPRILLFDEEPLRIAQDLQLQCLIVLGLEELSEDFLALLRVREQQLQEVALRDHRDLRELLVVDAEDLQDLPVDLPRLREHRAVRQPELRVRLLDRRATATLRRALVLRISLHGIVLPTVTEAHLDLRRGLRLRILRAQHTGGPVLARGLTEQSEGDRVEDRGLAGTGVARDEIKPAFAELLHIDFCHALIGSEGGQL